MDLSAFIVFIGTPVFADYIISNVLDQIPAFVNLKGQVKAIITLALSVILGLVSYYLTQTLTPATIAQLQPIFAVISAMVTAWLAGQIQHEIVAPFFARRNARIDYEQALFKAYGVLPAAELRQAVPGAPKLISGHAIGRPEIEIIGG